jgi:hypothetical protein
MKTLVRLAAATALLAGAGAPAYADLVLPSTGNSTAALTIFDSQNQRSLVVSLNVDFNSLLPSVIATSAGFNIANAIAATDQAEVAAFVNSGGTFTWWVSAADSAGLGNFGGRRVMTTGAPNVAPSFTNQGATQAANQAENFFNRVNQVCGPDDTCFADFEAEPTGTPDDFAAYAGNAWGSRWNNNLPPALNNGTAVGTAQAFYLWSTPESASAVGALQAARTDYRNATGSGLWNLTVSGSGAVLSYVLNADVPPVPLPAAVWLLLSGLAGVAAVGRRRAATPALATA